MKKILIKTIDPLIVDFRPGVSNEHETLDYVPASRLRGAFFEFRAKLEAMLGSPIDIETLLGYGGPRWTHAWPSDDQGNHWHVVPKCFKPEKNKPTPLWLERQGAHWQPRGVKQETNMSVGRHYGRRANREGALYAREAISPGQYFVAYTDFSGSLPSTSFTLNIGTRHSANGLCEICISDIPANDNRADFSSFDSGTGDFHSLGDSAAIQLLSDAIIPAPGGGYLRGLGEDDFELLAGCRVKLLSSCSGSKTVSGWSGKWGLPRESALAIEAGSVWLLQALEAKSHSTLRAFTDKCLKDGLGICTYEGFGTVAVNPPWLTLRDGPDLGCVLTPEVEEPHAAGFAGGNEHPPSWPETTGLQLDLLNAIIVSATNSVIEMRSNLDVKKLKHKAQEVRQWMTLVAHGGATDYPSMPGRLALDNVRTEQDIAIADWQAAQLFFLTVVETELKRQPQTVSAAAQLQIEGGME